MLRARVQYKNIPYYIIMDSTQTCISGVNYSENAIQTFLITHMVQKNGESSTSTNTSMSGGSYNIPECDSVAFLNLYYEHAIIHNKQMHLTERIADIGPILVDLDLKYDGIVTEKRHTCDHVKDLIYLYMEKIKQLVEFNIGDSFPVYVMEKDNTNPLADKNITKDGIHLQIGLKMSKACQKILRTNVLKDVGDVLDELELSNTYDNVIDGGLVNWTLYGSCKPNHEVYKLNMIADISVDNSHEFRIVFTEKSEIKHDIELFNKLVTRYTTWSTPEPRQEIKDQLAKTTNRPNIISTQSHTMSHNRASRDDEYNMDIHNIMDKQSLEMAVQNMLDSLSSKEHYIKEIHEYTQALLPKYYEPGSHELNRKVAFALKHTDNRLFLSWVMLRSKADDFDYTTVSDLHDTWNRYFNSGSMGDGKSSITRKSILFWVKQDSPEKYIEIQTSVLDHFIDKSIDTTSDVDFAIVLYQLHKDKYMCSSIAHNSWYVFNNHRWERDRGNTLRMSISFKMCDLYQRRFDECLVEMSTIEQTNPVYDQLKLKMGKLAKICKLLKTTSNKNNITGEAKELMYDKNFIKNMDSNKYLMCFTNGVVDFKTKEFRDGRPTDYITKCTGVPYRPFNEYELEELDAQEDIESMISKVRVFMAQLFPIPSLCQYMWDHLASCLIGAKKENAFNIYRGSGSNGKTILTELMSMALGEYKGTLPVNYVSDKRRNIGGASPEIIQLKGARYVVMEEASKNTVMNEGVMKDVTGGGPMQARALFSDSETFTPQFNLVVCTNSLFEIHSDDDGTWRRIKLVDFLAKFVGKNESYNDDSKYTFPKDKSLSDKLEFMAPVFVSMLVKRAFETDGEVIDCAPVIEASKNYRLRQDLLGSFIMTTVERAEKGEICGIHQRELSESFKLWHVDAYSGRNKPNASELFDLMTKKFGERIESTGKWMGVKIKYVKPESAADTIDAQ